MAALRHKVAANYLGQGWTALMGIVFVPLYLQQLGAEGFGLIGLMLGIQSLSMILDFGISVFLSREIARRNVEPRRQGSIRQLVRTFELLIWLIATLIAVGLVAGSQFIAIDWLDLEVIDGTSSTRAIQAIGAAVALLWPSSFYAAALNGLEQQPRLNVMAATFSTIRYAGVLPILHAVDGGVMSFVTWFAIVNGLQSACYAEVVWRYLPAGEQSPGFSPAEILGARSFAMGMFLVTTLSLLLTQADRFILASIRPLSELGYYSSALAVTAGLGRMLQPMFTAIYPRMCILVSKGDYCSLSSLYHLSSQAICVIASTLSLCAIAYSYDLLLLWTTDEGLARKVALPLAMLAAGTALNGLLIAPFALQLAHGRTRLAIVSNLIALAMGIPMCIAATSYFGMAGAASLWLATNAAFVATLIPALHRSMLMGEAMRWYVRDILPAVAAAGIVAASAKVLRPELGSHSIGIPWFAGTLLACLVAASFAAPDVRAFILDRARQGFKQA